MVELNDTVLEVVAGGNSSRPDPRAAVTLAISKIKNTNNSKVVFKNLSITALGDVLISVSQSIGGGRPFES